MNDSGIRGKMEESQDRQGGRKRRREDRQAERIDRANATPSRVTVAEVEGGWRMTITPPQFRRYFRCFSLQSFWAVFMMCFPFLVVGTLLLASETEKYIPNSLAAHLVTALLLTDVPLLLFLFFVKLFRSSFHIQVMDGKYAILRGKGMRFKRSGAAGETSWRLKHSRNGWVRLEWRTRGTWWGFEYLNYNDIAKVREFMSKRMNGRIV